MEGSVLRSGTRVQITARLIEAATDTQIWSQSYERDLLNVVELDSKVAQAIANEIHIQLSAEERAQASIHRAVRPEAFDAYLKGRYYWEKRTPADLNKSIEYFHKAIELDPAYALAYAGIADTYAVLGNNQIVQPKEAFPQAETAARKALEFDENLAEAHASLGFSLWNYEFDWDGTDREFKRAIQLNPGYATAYHWYSGYLSSMGHHDAAIGSIMKARELDPLSPRISANVAFILYFARRYGQAIEELQRAQVMDPSSGTVQLYLGMAYSQMGDHPRAIAALTESIRLSGKDATAELELAYAHALAGHRTEALRLLDQAMQASQKGYTPALWVARVYVALGEKKTALDWMEKAYEERSPQLSFIQVDPRLDPLRSDPAFLVLLHRMKLKD